MKDAEVLSRRTAHQGSFLRLDTEEVRLPNGQVARLEVVRHPGSAAVVPILPGGEVVLLRQYRHAVGRWLLEVPGRQARPGGEPRSLRPAASSPPPQPHPGGTAGRGAGDPR